MTAWLLRRRRRILQGALLWIVPLVLAWIGWRTRWVTEDAFIDFRIIDHFLAGHGPVFNIGERVEAYTNALWIAILALLAAPLRPLLHQRVPLEWMAVILGIASSALGVLFAERGALRLARAQGRVGVALPLGAVAIAVLPPAWSFASSGLETGLAMGWLGLCFWGVTRFPRKGRRWLPPVLGLGPLIRPDLAIYSAGFLFTALVVLYDRRARGLGVLGARGAEAARKPGRARALAPYAKLVAGAIAIPFAYEIFRMGYFAAIVPNTAIAKEAGSSRWDQGLFYLDDFAGTYRLWIPSLAALLALVLGVVRVVRVQRGRRARRLVLALVPVICGLLHVAFVTRVGGDFMHGRMLLPAWFALLLPVAAVAGSRRWPPIAPALVIVPWAIACALYWRVPYVGPGKDGIGPKGIADERYYYSDRIQIPYPVTVDDYSKFGWASEGQRLRDIARKRRVLFPWRPESEKVKGRTHEMDLAARVPSKVVSAFGHIGLMGYVAGTRVHLVDRLGLGDAFAARIELKRRGRPGHEKFLPDEWVVARYAAILDAPDQEAKLEPKIRDARDALRCGDLAELREATEAPLTLRRFFRNMMVAPRLHRFRFPADPTEAKAALCGTGKP